MPTILVVEDERIVAEDIRRSLGRLGYTVPYPVASGQEALRQTGELRPDLVLMDIHLGGEMDGIQAAAKMHEWGIPVVFLSAYADDDTLRRAMAGYPSGYLIKPFSDRELRSTIEVALHKNALELQLQKTRRELEEKVAELEAQEIERWRREEIQSVQFRAREVVWKMRRPEDIDQVKAAVGDCLRALGVPFAGLCINLVEERENGATVACHLLGEQGKILECPAGAPTGAVIRAWRTKTPVYRSDLHGEDEWAERSAIEAEYGSVRSVLDAPFSYGTLAVNNPRPHAFSKDDIRSVQVLSQVLSEGFRRLDDLRAVAEKEMQLQQAQKMEAVGLLAGGVAHDFNNLITVISGYCQLLRKGMTETDAPWQYVREIEQSGERVAAMVRRLMAFSRRQVVEPRVLDFNQVLAGVRKILSRLLGEDIDMVWEPAGDLGRVEADPGQLEQVVMNLAVNARDAMPDGGQLILKTADVYLDEDDARCHPGAHPGSYVLLEVRDTGVGMDAETRARIFEPFFTTKEQRGTGLGLATVYGIVDQSGGHIQVDSQPGEGTTFRVYLPRVDAEAACCEESAPAGDEVGGDETVLVVEDEGAVRRLAQRILEERGYRVLVAAQAEEGMRIAALHDGPIELLLTDVVMPGMSGPELAEQVTAMRAESGVLFMSGYAGREPGPEEAVPRDPAYLRKPFTPEELLRAVRSALDGRHAAVGKERRRARAVAGADPGSDGHPPHEHSGTGEMA